MSGTDWVVTRLEQPTGSASRIVPMEGMRGLAALLVFFVHASYPPAVAVGGSPLRWFAVQLQDFGNIGVDVFFALSGFLIYGSLIERQQRFVPFLARRVERLYPTFAVVLAATVLLEWGDFWSKRGLATQVLWLAANATMLIGLTPLDPIVFVSWSISWELGFYVAIPLLISWRKLRERSRSDRIRFFGVCFAVLVIVPGLQRCAMFVVGIILHEVMRLRADQISARARIIDRWALGMLAVGGAAAFVLDSRGPIGTLPRTLVLAAVVPLVMAAGFSTDGHVARVFSWRPLRWAGNMSYSYYLLHPWCIEALRRATGWTQNNDATTGAYWVWVCVAFGATILGALVLYLSVEHPLSLQRRFKIPLGWLRFT